MQEIVTRRTTLDLSPETTRLPLIYRSWRSIEERLEYNFRSNGFFVYVDREVGGSVFAWRLQGTEADRIKCRFPVAVGSAGRRGFQETYGPMTGAFMVARRLVQIRPFRVVWAQTRVTLKQQIKSEWAFMHLYNTERETFLDFSSHPPSVGGSNRRLLLGCQVRLRSPHDRGGGIAFYSDDLACPNPSTPRNHPQKSLYTRAALSSETGDSPRNNLLKNDLY